MPELEVVFGKGSGTKATFWGPLWMRPLLRDHLEVIKAWASALLWVAVGNGMDVVDEREYWAAREAAGMMRKAEAAVGSRRTDPRHTPRARLSRA